MAKLEGVERRRRRGSGIRSDSASVALLVVGEEDNARASLSLLVAMEVVSKEKGSER